MSLTVPHLSGVASVPSPASDVERFLSALFPGEDGVLDLRALPGPMQTFCAVTDLAAVAAFLERHRDRNCYVGLATRRDASSGTLANCLDLAVAFVDLDFKTISETDARIRLGTFPIPPHVIVESGGGLHVYWRLKEPWQLPADAAVATSCLRRLAAHFGGDFASAEPAHVLRLPSSTNHKREYDSPRPVVLAHLEEGAVNVSELLEWVPPEPARANGSHGATPFTVPEQIRDGARNRTLYRLARSLHAKGLSPAAIRAALHAENQATCAPPLPAEEVEQIATHAAAQPDRADFVGGDIDIIVDTPTTGDATPTITGRRLVFTPASTITVRPVRWAWTDRVPVGTLGLIGGREGLGKSILSTTLAAQMTLGTLPGAYFGRPRTVIICAKEDSWEHTIVPRLMAAGADLARVGHVEVTTAECVETSLSLPRDLVALEQLIHDEDAGLVILDPLLSRLDASLDSHKDADVRRALEPLASLANRADAAVLGLIHVNKSTSGDPLTMLMASRAFAAVARSVLFVMADPDDEQHRLLGQPKNNLGRLDLPTLGFRIAGAHVATTAEGEVWTGQLTWTGETTRSITEALEVAAQTSGDRTATDEAKAWLDDYLTSQGGSAESRKVKAAGKEAGHATATLARARQLLRVTTSSDGFPCRTTWHLSRLRLQSSHRSGETYIAATTETTTANRSITDLTVVPVVSVVEGPHARETTGEEDA